MMRSMYTGVSGLRTHQTKMDVIGNNISNVNTVGYKSSSVTFKEIFAQTLQNAGSADQESGRGGINPIQIGLGVNIASIDKMMAQGAAQVTDNPLDMMIDGSSFFIVGDGSGQYFTRAGSFKLDANGNLVNPSGLMVYGWNAAEDPDNPGNTIIQKGRVSPLRLKAPENLYIEPKPTTSIAFEGNLNIDDGKYGIVKSFDFYDSLGNHYKVDMTFKYIPERSVWSFEPAGVMKRNETSTIAFSWDHSDCELSFDEYGRLLTVDGEDQSFITFNLTQGLEVNAEIPEITLDFNGLTQFNQQTTAKGASIDGNSAGELSGFTVSPEGIITGTYTNGRLKQLGQLSVASFKNPAGLEKVGDNLFCVTPNSGEFDGIGESVSSNGGRISGGALEMSNVDLAREFTEMITTQRGFQANSKVITTSDEMLQELVRLK